MGTLEEGRNHVVVEDVFGRRPRVTRELATLGFEAESLWDSGTTTGALTDGALTSRKCKGGFGNRGKSLKLVDTLDPFTFMFWKSRL